MTFSEIGLKYSHVSYFSEEKKLKNSIHILENVNYTQVHLENSFVEENVLKLNVYFYWS